MMALPRMGENKAIIDGLDFSLDFRFLVSKNGRRRGCFAFMFQHGFEVYLALQPRTRRSEYRLAFRMPCNFPQIFQLYCNSRNLIVCKLQGLA